MSTTPEDTAIKDNTKEHKLSKSDKNIWSKFMTPEYVYEKDGSEYVKIMFMGYEKMEQLWRIVKL